MDFGGGGTEREGWVSYANELWMTKKRSSQASWKNDAWELLPQICVVSGNIMWISGQIHKIT
jgi:hypothetical protein